MAEQTQQPTFRAAIVYQNDREALAWLEKAFGFETSLVITDDSGTMVHSEMRFGDGAIMVAHEWSAETKSPKSVGGINTQAISVHVEGDIEAHCERARAAGAKIIQEPLDQFYGDRNYRCIDPEGHVWSFGQTLKVMTLADMEKAAGGQLKVRQKL